MRIPSWPSILSFPIVILMLSTRAGAQGYPYYGGATSAPDYNNTPDYTPPPAYRPIGMWLPSGAALGPWRWNFNVGGGPTSVVGRSHDALTSGWNFNVGTGYNFTPRTGFILEFMQTGLGLTDSTLQANQANDGDASIWSMTLDPIWRYRVSGPIGGYIVGGGGFYELDERFTQPVNFFVPTFGGGGFVGSGTAVTHEIDDTGGLNIGTGLTCNLGWGTKFFVEVRYHYIFTSGTPTQIIPVTLGLRW